MKYANSLLSVSLLLMLFSCKSSRVPSVDTVETPSLILHGKAFATLFQQSAAEYKALCYQAFNIARLRIDADTISSSLPRAIITDLDETILDNSPYAVHQLHQNKDYDPVSWKQWTDQASASAVPGAVALLQYASAKGIRIFYISNRGQNELESTRRNLEKLGLPDAIPDHLLFKTDRSGKEARRQLVLSNHRVILLLGDNLSDFTDAFDKKPQGERDAVVTQWEQSFGQRFIVLPNSVYGDWEGALYGHKIQTAAQKDSVYRKALKGY